MTFPIVATAVIYGPYLTMPVVFVLGLLGIAAITSRAGAAFGIPVALASFLAFDWYYAKPTRSRWRSATMVSGAPTLAEARAWSVSRTGSGLSAAVSMSGARLAAAPNCP
ncbi:hypothetical protein AB0J72_21280 [Dactylosporangium sp. NPDC049742]|uniref:hypothetical protein n=1 Tax=Dactylosporangium sp. NPDC049742 TaxID=3154737 RepID=UPI0034371A37